MEITEKDLEDLIFDALIKDHRTLTSIGFKTDVMALRTPNKVVWNRQVELGDYGRADIIGYTRGWGTIFVDIIELKNVPITHKDFEQICRYRTAVREIIRNTFKGHFWPEVHIYLVGPSIDSGHFIQDHTGCRMFIFSYGLTGFAFNQIKGKWYRGNGDLTMSKVSAQKTVSTLYGK